MADVDPVRRAWADKQQRAARRLDAARTANHGDTADPPRSAPARPVESLTAGGMPSSHRPPNPDDWIRDLLND